ncbi:MAG: hypothetical protein M3066_19400 [Actinomycetota bacterium]|nr:hypothetical protein [Actinomycetota bacterium]
MDDPDGAVGPAPARKPSDRATVAVLVALVVVLIVAAVGVARVRDARKLVSRAVAATTTTTAPAAGSATTVAGDGLSSEQRQIVDDVKAQVSAIRGLAWKRDLPVRVLSKDELAQKIRDLDAAQAGKTRDAMTADETVLKVLQLIPRSVDYVKTLDALFSGAVLGFYDDETRELYVGGGGAAGTIDVATRSVLAHELTHALTDQQFDFGAATRALDDQNRSEESAAFSAMIEGDAELVRTMWAQKNLTATERAEAARGGSDDSGIYARVPPYLVHSLRFPYDQGLAFVQARFQAGGFAAVDDAYRMPPVSTEQIIHPELYAAAQGWTAPMLPDLAAATGCGKVETGTLGEFDMSEVLARQLSAVDSRRAAAGWNGDGYSVVRCGAAVGLAERWQTDAPADAGRLVDALTRWSRGWSGSSRAPDASGRFAGPNGAGRISQSPGRVDLVLADDVTTADRVGGVLAGAR